MPQTSTERSFITTDIPARLERLRWGHFHSLVVIALGVTWALDGLEVTLAGAVAGALKDSPSLALSNAQVGLASSFYLAGAVLGALFFGWLTDRLGRKRLFSVTLGLYLVATAATALSWDFYSFSLFRFLTGAGIGGEYTAIASAIQEFIPARYRGWTDLVINGSFWIGAAIGAASSVVLLDPTVLAPDFGWRAAFFIGALLGLFILLLRAWIPESPRWLVTHGRLEEAQAVLADIEDRHRRRSGPLPALEHPSVKLNPRRSTPLAEVWHTLYRKHRRRTFVGLTLMASQAFFYNAIFFTYALVLTDFYGIRADHVGWYLFPFAIGNFLGPVMLGRFFDTVGRKPMIALTYALSGVLLAVTGYLFAIGALSATGQTIAWTVIFFFASAAASSAYLTVSETFPLEIRALAIAFFYAVGTGVGGIVGPGLFGVLIETGSRISLALGYLLGAVFMLAASVIAARFGVAAERKPLEAVARPISAVD
jgi:MFS family permease